MRLYHSYVYCPVAHGYNATSLVQLHRVQQSVSSPRLHPNGSRFFICAEGCTPHTLTSIATPPIGGLSYPADWACDNAESAFTDLEFWDICLQVSSTGRPDLTILYWEAQPSSTGRSDHPLLLIAATNLSYFGGKH